MPRILIPLAQGCEELEAVTMIDLMRRAKLDVVTAGLEPDIATIHASRGTRLLADTTLNAVIDDHFDMIALPGGLPGANHLAKDERLRRKLRTMAAEGQYTAAICAAPKALAEAGLLEGKRATSYPGALDDYTIAGLTYVDEAVVVDGQVVTSRGPGTAIDFALTLIELLGGRALRKEVEEPLLRP